MQTAETHYTPHVVDTDGPSPEYLGIWPIETTEPMGTYPGNDAGLNVLIEYEDRSIEFYLTTAQVAHAAAELAKMAEEVPDAAE